MKKSIRVFAIHMLLLATVVLGSAVAVGPAAAETIRVFAAASLTEAFQEIAALYEQQNPGDDVELNFAGSQVLRTQILEGAPADVFASADPVHMDALKSANRIAKAAVFTRNRLVVVTPAAHPKVTKLGDLARPGIRLVIANGNVPVGRYTTQAFGKMNRVGLLGDDFQKRVTTNILSQETNVRAVLAKVMLDEVDAGVVYLTDARTAGGKVRILDIPDRMNVEAEYPIAVLRDSKAAEGAARFVALVRSGAGQAFLAARGFLPAE